ncbi:MAG: peptidoglycan DD-metalloendopeptidase family protein [Oscillospiraceae bacterium]|nr:peptidoglycan DD-metalloendopeptidase family protein [Oscillospiraceae bacterium]
MKPFIRSAGAALLAALMVSAALPGAVWPGTVWADDSLSDMEQRQQELQQRLDEANRNLAAMEGRVDQQEAYNQQLYEQLMLSQQQVDLMGEQILALSADIADRQQKKEQLEEDIAAAGEQIADAEQSLSDTVSQFQTRMRSLYMAGELSSLRMLLSADSFSDFFTGAALMKAVSQSDQQLVLRLREQKTGLETQKEELETRKQQLERETEEILSQRAALTGQQEALRTAQASLSDSYAENQELLDQYAAQADDALQDLNALREESEQVEKEIQAWFAEQERLRREEEERRRQEEERLRQEEEERRRQEEAAASEAGESSEESSEPSSEPSEESGSSDSPGSSGSSDSEVHTNFIWPLNGFYTVWCSYGQQTGYFHYGIDISGGGINGADILAAESGTVILAASHYSYGNYVIIDHGGGYATLYAHASALLVSAGDTVTRGQVIAKVGSTGNSTGPHLHFEVRINGVTQNPLGYVSP